MTSSRRSPSAVSISDRDLIVAARAGNLESFSMLVERHQASLINFFFHCSYDRQTAEDCAQEIFVKLYGVLHRYEPRAKFTTFLYRIARNHWIDRLRTSHGRTASLDAPVSGVALRDRLPAPGDSPVETINRRETREAVWRALDQLSEEQRTVVILSEFQGMRYQDIAEVLEAPVGTIKSRMFTALERLKEIMGDEL